MYNEKHGVWKLAPPSIRHTKQNKKIFKKEIQTGIRCTYCLARHCKARYTLETKSTVDFLCRRFVAGSFDQDDRIAVDIVATVEHVQLCRLCRMWVIFVARMSNVLSTLSPVCTGLKDTSVGTTIIIKIGDLNRCARNSVRATYLWHTVYVSARNARSSDDRDRREVWLTLQLASCNSAFDKYSLHELGICGDELVVTRHRLAGCL